MLDVALFCYWHNVAAGWYEESSPRKILIISGEFLSTMMMLALRQPWLDGLGIAIIAADICNIFEYLYNFRVISHHGLRMPFLDT